MTSGCSSIDATEATRAAAQYSAAKLNCLGRGAGNQAPGDCRGSALVHVQAAVLGHARHQVFHLILENAAILQDQMLVTIGYVGRIDERHMRRLGRTAPLERVARTAGGHYV